MMLQLITKFSLKYYLKIDVDRLPTCDILNIILKDSKKQTENTANRIHVAPINLKVNDQPLSSPIFISGEILSAHKRTSASSKLKTVGTQHVFLHEKMIDTSESSSCEEDTDYEPVRVRKRNI